MLADLRVQAVRADDEVVAAALAVGERRVHVVVVTGDELGECDARAHVGARRERAGREDLVELGPGEAVAGRQPGNERRPIMGGDRRLAVGQPGAIAADGRAGFHARRGQSQ